MQEEFQMKLVALVIVSVFPVGSWMHRQNKKLSLAGKDPTYDNLRKFFQRSSTIPYWCMKLYMKSVTVWGVTDG